MQVKALAYGRDHRTKLIELMNQKEAVGDVFNQLRLALQRRTAGRPAQVCLRLYYLWPLSNVVVSILFGLDYFECILHFVTLQCGFIR